MRVKLVCVVALLYFLTFSLTGYAAGPVINSVYEFGRRDQQELINDGNYEDIYSFVKIKSKISHKVDEYLSYDLSHLYSTRDYMFEEELDNRTDGVKGGASFLLIDDIWGNLVFDLDLAYRQKRYYKIFNNEYDHYGVVGKAKVEIGEDFFVGLSSGGSHYDYLNAAVKDSSKNFYKVEVKKKAYEGVVRLVSSYKYERIHDGSNERDDENHTVGGGVDFRSDVDLVKLLRFRIKIGGDDTKEDWDRDDDFDYEFMDWYIRSEHKINEQLFSSFEFHGIRKDYDIDEKDNHGYVIEGSCKYVPIDDKILKVVLSLDLSHKELEFTSRQALNYRREVLRAEFKNIIKKNLEFSIYGSMSEYDFSNNSTRNKTPYSVGGSIKKYILDENCRISCEFEHKVIDYVIKKNIETNVVKIAMNCRF